MQGAREKSDPAPPFFFITIDLIHRLGEAHPVLVADQLKGEKAKTSTQTQQWALSPIQQLPGYECGDRKETAKDVCPK